MKEVVLEGLEVVLHRKYFAMRVEVGERRKGGSGSGSGGKKVASGNGGMRSFPDVPRGFP